MRSSKSDDGAEIENLIQDIELNSNYKAGSLEIFKKAKANPTTTEDISMNRKIQHAFYWRSGDKIVSIKKDIRSHLCLSFKKVEVANKFNGMLNLVININ